MSRSDTLSAAFPVFVFLHYSARVNYPIDSKTHHYQRPTIHKIAANYKPHRLANTLNKQLTYFNTLSFMYNHNQSEARIILHHHTISSFIRTVFTYFARLLGCCLCYAVHVQSEIACISTELLIPSPLPSPLRSAIAFTGPARHTKLMPSAYNLV